MSDTFRLWAMGDAHVGRDIKHGRESLADALRQSETGNNEGAPPFDWDIAVNVGDYSGASGAPVDAEGMEVVRQFSVLKDHRREQIYSVCGNHDRSAPNEPEAWWFRKYVDPIGENTSHSGVDGSRRPYPVTGSWERYSFQVGNLLFLMMSDINPKTQKIGRGELGGNPGGAVSSKTFDWWCNHITNNNDKCIISIHHYVLKDTTVASGEWEGMKKDADGKWVGNYHRFYDRGTPNGASYLYWVGGSQDSGKFENFLDANRGRVDLWMGGHTHAMPDDTYGEKAKINRRWGTHFLNVCPLTRHVVPDHARPHSRLLTFTEGSKFVRVQCYFHTSEFRPLGWDPALEQTIELSRPFYSRA